MKLFSFSLWLSFSLSSRLNNCFSCFYVFVHQAHFCHFLHIRWSHIIREIRVIRVQVKKVFSCFVSHHSLAEAMLEFCALKIFIGS